MKKIIGIISIALATQLLQAQESNLQTFTPSALFSAGEYEVNVFNSIYTQNKLRDSEGNTRELGQTQAFFNSMIQYTTGSGKFSRINFGFDVNITSARYGKASEDSPLDVFKGDAAFQETVVSSFGPRVKFNLSKRIPRLSVQSTFLFPVSKKLEENQFIAHDRYTWFTQFFFDKSFGENFQVFLEADFLYRINRNSTNPHNFFRTPLSAFLSYFPDSKSTIFVFSQYSPRFETVSNSIEEEFGLSQWFTQLGVGAKYQLIPSLGVELSYGNFIASRLDGAGYTANFGLRYIHR